MQKISVAGLQSGVPITMLIPLYARAIESQRPGASFRDEAALAIVEQVDYDFAAFAADPATQLGIAIRTEILDQYAADFIRRYPKGRVVNLGAGLDTRFSRLDNGQISWVELDLPEAIDFREQFLRPGPRHVHFRTSVLDYRWLAQLPKAEQTLIIAEGLLMYLAEPQIKSLFRALLDWLPRAEILAEAVGTHMLNHQNASVSSTAAQFQWGIDDSSDMVFWHDRLEWWGDISIYDRYPDRWAALYPDLQTPLAELRHKVTKIVHLAIV